MSSYRIEALEVNRLSDDELGPIGALVDAIRAEGKPRAKPRTIRDHRQSLNPPGQIEQHHVAWSEAGNPVGFLQVHYADDGSNPHMVRVDVSVDSGHRQKGIASSLLRNALEFTKSAGRTLITGFILSTIPAAASFADHFGLRRTVNFRESVLNIENMNLEQLHRWRSDGPNRAHGYSVELIHGSYPERILEGLAGLYMILQRDSPAPEGREPNNWTPELVASEMDHFLEGAEAITAIALHATSEMPVGLSQLYRRESDPDTWMVTMTMVHPDHRGHALGKWIKAEVNLEALSIWPGGKYAETGNASGNDAMLGINEAMGFEHEYTMTEVEIEVDRLDELLRGRGF